MHDVNETSFGPIFLMKAIEQIVKSPNKNVSDDSILALESNYFLSVTDFGCAISNINDYLYNNPNENHEIHCVFNVNDQMRSYEDGNSCVECLTNKNCSKVAAYICGRKDVILKILCLLN